MILQIFSVIMALLGIKQTVIVDDDDVWEAYIKVLFFLFSKVARLKGFTISFRTEHAIVW